MPSVPVLELSTTVELELATKCASVELQVSTMTHTHNGVTTRIQGSIYTFKLR